MNIRFIMRKSNKSSGSHRKNFNLAPGFTKSEKIKRAKYLSERLNNLYVNLTGWVSSFENYSLKKININVDGEKLPAAEIYSGKKLIASIKPIGLFAFGFNCRIDITSGETTNVLFDTSKENAEPAWQLFSYDAGKKPKKLTKVIFRNLIKVLNRIDVK
jgi:hypothetical protein